MANKFQIKRTSTSGLLPNTTNSGNTSYIAAGELALNLTDKKMVSSNGSATFEIGANLTNLSVSGNVVASNLEITDTATINTNSITVGNSTVNTIITGGSLDIGGDINANGSVGTAGQVLRSGGSGANAYWSTATGSPGGSNTQVQFNDSDGFGGDAGLTYNKSTDALTVAGSFLVGANVIANTSALLVGNSSVNAVLTQSSFDIDGTIAAGNTTITGFANVSTTATIGTGFTLTSGNANFDSGVLFVDGTNNRVGVGTTSPSARLDVRTAAGTTANAILYTGNSSSAATFSFGQTGAVQWDTGITATGGHYQIAVNGGGIGYQINRSGTAVDYHSWLTNGSERVRITSAGYVGIGTASPGTVLHTVNTSAGAATVGAFLQNSSGTANTEVRLAFASNENTLAQDRYGWIGYINTGGTNSGALTFATTPGGEAATERMRINSSGNVGIGTSSPSVKLDVNGSLAVNGSITANSGVGSAGQVLTSGGSGQNAYWSTVSGGGGSTSWTRITANTTATAGGKYIGVCSSQINLTLPSLSEGNEFIVNNSKDSTANVRVVVGASVTVNNPSFATGDNIVLAPGETVYLVAESSTELEIV